MGKYQKIPIVDLDMSIVLDAMPDADVLEAGRSIQDFIFMNF